MDTAITSRDNDRVKTAVKLASSAAFRAQQGLFFAEGPRLCADLAESGGAVCLFVTEKALAARPELRGLAPEVLVVAPHVADKLGGTRSPQGVFGLFRLPAPGWDVLRPADGVLLCEDVQDPANVGTVVRSAAGLGFGGVVLCGASADPYGPKALRASMGAVGRVPVLTAPDAEQAAEKLRALGCTLYAAALQDSIPLPQATVKAPFALMVGNEGQGLSQQLAALADIRVRIPMENGVESLNAAAAAAVLIYHFKHHRGEGAPP